MFLEEECARAERSRGAFAVLRVQVEDAPKGIPEEVLAECTRTVDLVAAYGPAEYEVLLIDVDRPRSDEARRRLLAGFSDRGVVARVGGAHYPEDGRNPETLLFRANSRLLGEGDAKKSASIPAAAAAIVVQDPTMVRLYGLAERIADSTISVLLLGETGVGKEILAETIHQRSPRRDQPFVKLNCAALSESLLESELFGHERGAFTGAVQAKAGLLESAHGGTVFLDEVGELGPATQVKLLRVLEERKVTRVGSVKPKEIDVRFVAATNRDLEAEVAAGTFREDLFFRLNGIPLVIPPLRERPVEIEPLARSLMAQTCKKNGRPVPELRREAIEILRRYAWPGNIRELRNVMERAVLLAGGEAIGPEHLPVEKMVGAQLPARATGRSLPPTPAPRAAPIAPPSRRPAEFAHDEVPAGRPTLPPPDAEETGPWASPLKSGMEQAERDLILKALEQCAGNQTQAAKLLGISRRTLVSRLEQYQLPRPRKGLT
ncbi:MAG: sigma 54-interacting transcriptional regulator [Myxococcales bacterium]|nr:sigma 54-interacting transcriptional regulator [Myxococcales bacterium]